MEFNSQEWLPSLPIRNLLGEIVMIWTHHTQNNGVTYDFLQGKTSNFPTEKPDLYFAL